MNVYREITPLKEADVLVVLDSVCNGFDYPIHNHPECELNFVVGISGTRIVGDSTERYAGRDLVLLGPYLYHKWDGDAEIQRSDEPYRVITVQFSMEIFRGPLFQKERFFKIQQLLRDAGRGLKFHGKTVDEAARLLVGLTEDRGFRNIIEFLELFDLLSQSTEFEFLASEGFSPQALRSDSNRIRIAYSHILKHFADPAMRIGDVAGLVNMQASAFGHFFQKYAFRSFTQFLLDVRIGHACKLLLDSDEPVNQISWRSGFNNLANFNRLFKKYRLVSPVEYRRRHLEKGSFDWTHQVTPMQFLPPGKGPLRDDARPAAYATRTVHL